jgi:hypothetical protein
MGALVLHNPKITLDEVVAGAPAGTPVDVSCHVSRVEITVDQEEKDVPTFCNPGGIEYGPPTYGADVDWRLENGEGTEDPTHTALAPFVGSEVLVAMKAHDAATEQLSFRMDFGSVNPGSIGSWEAGESVEASTSHTVPAEPVWGTAA